MIYKHAISTVVPSRAVKLDLDGDDDDAQKGPGNE
jgi:sRNA-binding regulator protein Hfq